MTNKEGFVQAKNVVRYLITELMNTTFDERYAGDDDFREYINTKCSEIGVLNRSRWGTFTLTEPEDVPVSKPRHKGARPV